MLLPGFAQRSFAQRCFVQRWFLDPNRMFEVSCMSKPIDCSVEVASAFIIVMTGLASTAGLLELCYGG